jgi:YD repeat-containing protein
MKQTSSLSSETYEYDKEGNLIRTQETPVGGSGCVTRLYEYSEESGQRTSATTREPGAGGACATEGGMVEGHFYDSAGRVIDPGVTYDALGNMTKAPAGDAGGKPITSSFYADNQVATQEQAEKTIGYTYDSAGRTITTRTSTMSGTTTTVNHYAGAGSALTWTCIEAGSGECAKGTATEWTRNIPGIDGGLDAIQTNSTTPVLQLHDLQGSIVATAADNETATKLLSTQNNTEFGVPTEGAGAKYSWLGAEGLESELGTGVITSQGATYVPQLATILQSEGTIPPGAEPVITAGAGVYETKESAMAIESGDIAAANTLAEQRALEELAVNFVDPVREYPRLTARAVGELYLKLKTLEEVLGLFDIPTKAIDLVEKYVIDKIGMDQVLAWLHDAGEKLVKCSNNKRVLQTRRGPIALAMCGFGFGLIEFTFKPDHDIKFSIVNFWEEPWVMECAMFGPENIICPAEVHIPKEIG